MFGKKNKKTVVDVEIMEIVVRSHMKSAKEAWRHRMDLTEVCQDERRKLAYSQEAHEELIRYTTLQKLYNDLCEQSPEFREAVLTRKNRAET